jgi:CRAL/TRIO domain
MKSSLELINDLVCHDVDHIDDTGCKQKHPNETIELIQQSLQEFDIELKHQTTNLKSKDDGKYYLMAVSTNPQWALCDWKFRLQFLRTEIFQVKLAVQRFLTYWKNRYDLYGNDEYLAFHRTIQRTMSQMDIESVEAGFSQSVLGHSRINYVNPAGTPKDYDIDSVVRSIQYCMEAKLRYTTNDENIQKKGLVSFVDFKYIRRFDRKLVNRISTILNDGFPSRTTMTIIINAPPGTSYFVALLKQFLKPKLRERFHVFNQHTSKLTRLTGISSYDELYQSLNHNEWLSKLRDIENAQEVEMPLYKQGRQEKVNEVTDLNNYTDFRVKTKVMPPTVVSTQIIC